MPDQPDTNAEVLHQLELVRRDLAHLSTRVGELVSTERYTIEQAAQNEAIRRLEQRMDKTEQRNEARSHVIVSAFIFPLVIAFITYFLLKG